MPHRGHWDDAHICDISEAWNRPIVQATGVNEGSHSLLSLDRTGYQLSSLTVDADGSVLLRLYNADGDDLSHDICLDLPITAVSEIDLRGNEVSRPPFSNHRLTVQMPRFGIRTYRLTL